MGDPRNGGRCVPCLEFCNGHSEFCYHIDHFNGTPTSQLYAEDSRWPQFTLDPEQLETEERGPRAEEAVCVNCQEMTIGKMCDHCKLGYYGGAANGQTECKACDCNGHGDTCDEVIIRYCLDCILHSSILVVLHFVTLNSSIIQFQK